MTPEQRLDRAERMLLMLVKAGRDARKEFREKINILIDTQIETGEQLKRTDEQLKRTGEQLKRTDEQIEALTAGQAKTDDALRRLINSLRKGQNGNS